MGNIPFGSLFLIACLIGFHTADAFGCYKCNSNEHESCTNEPDQLALTSVVECDGFCTTLRTEYTDIPGVVVALVRDCEKNPIVQNGIRTDKHYTKMYSSCNTDRCNSEDGKREPGDGDAGRTGPKDVITVFESGSNWLHKPSYIFILGSVSIYLLF